MVDKRRPGTETEDSLLRALEGIGQVEGGQRDVFPARPRKIYHQAPPLTSGNAMELSINDRVELVDEAAMSVNSYMLLSSPHNREQLMRGAYIVEKMLHGWINVEISDPNLRALIYADMAFVYGLLSTDPGNTQIYFPAQDSFFEYASRIGTGEEVMARIALLRGGMWYHLAASNFVACGGNETPPQKAETEAQLRYAIRQLIPLLNNKAGDDMIYALFVLVKCYALLGDMNAVHRYTTTLRICLDIKAKKTGKPPFESSEFNNFRTQYSNVQIGTPFVPSTSFETLRAFEEKLRSLGV